MIKRRWGFRCNVANERTGDDKADVQGLGHAMRCVSLARKAMERGDEVLVSLEGAPDVEEYFERLGIDFVLNEPHQQLFVEYEPDVIVTDVNYLEQERVSRYRELAPVVNLAPRGSVKFYADLTFTSERIADVESPSDSPLQRWYSGPEYTIIGDDFLEVRRRLKEQEQMVGNTVVIHMGGVDRFDRTGGVLRLLEPNSLSGLSLRVIAGPFNPNIKKLVKLCGQFRGDVEFKNAPENLAGEMVSSRFAILGTGISTYEALGIGVPSLNVGLSAFHDLRGEVLESEGLGIYLGQHNNLDCERINKILRTVTENSSKLERIRKKGFRVIDGLAAQRIVNRTCDFLQ